MALTKVQSGIVETGAALENIGVGNITPEYLAQKMTLGTAVATTSGTSKDFTGIPSWVKRITVMFSGVSTSGSSPIQIQLGSGSVTTSGYTSTFIRTAAGGSSGGTTTTTGLGASYTSGASDVVYGQSVITNISSNIWVSASMTQIGASNMTTSTGQISLGGTLDRVRITTVNGTDTFDAGSVNILYEG